jgi:23S rRNA (uracil1939-C5)-methyltransferase
MKPSPQPAGDTPRTEVIRILDVADRGAALGRLDGKALFVPFAAPGDLAEVVVTRERTRYAEGRLLRVLEPSALRRPPACPAFGECGGCRWQHLPYADQWAGKARAFQGFLRSRLGLAEERFRPPLASPDEWGYRNRASVKVRRLGNDVLLGFFEQATHRIVPIHGCPVLTPGVGARLTALGSFLRGFRGADGIAQVDFQEDGRRGVWVVFHVWHPLPRGEVGELAAFARDADLVGAHLQTGRKDTLVPLIDGPARMPFRVSVGDRQLALGLSPGGFAQANPGVNQAMVDEVIGLADLYRGRDALDLYCGAGNFTLPMALAAASVVGVEGYRPAAADAAGNAAVNGLANVRVLAEPVERGLGRLEAEDCRPAFALLDPPREGAGQEVVRLLARLDPEHILYVSCAPPTLARDLGALAAAGYRAEWVRAADMFPQTAHVESLTLLQRAL